MIYTTYYNSPIGKILLASKNKKLVGLWIEGQKHYLGNIKEELVPKDNEEIFVKTKKWLDEYFKGNKPEISELEFELIGTNFRKSVWKLLCKIQYGEVITYGMLAKELMKIMNKEKMSARAVGSAVAHNPISIIIPCHRVIGKNGNLTGYASGINNKIKLLKHENVDIDNIKL